MHVWQGGWLLVDFDPVTQKSIWAQEDGDVIRIREDQPVDALIEQNRREFNAAEAGWKGDWHKIASIPSNIFMNSGLDEAIGQRDDRFLSRFLNDSDNRAWRVKPGRV